jgi:hypothetical protein
VHYIPCNSHYRVFHAKEADMQTLAAKQMLDKESFMIDLFIAIAQVMDLDDSVKKSWVKGLQNRKSANKALSGAANDTNFADLVKGELELLGRLKAQIPNPKAAYEICWLENITSDEKILQNI